MSAKVKTESALEMNRMKHRGFTLVELLMVIAVVSILLTLITTAASNAIKSAREKRAEAMRIMLESGIATYHAQEGKWPGAIETYAQNGQDRTLQESEAQRVFQEICKKSIGKNGNPYVDASALFVAPAGARNGRDSGIGLREAIRRGEHRRRYRISELHFGYAKASGGRFQRYGLAYHASSDSVTVTK